MSRREGLRRFKRLILGRPGSFQWWLIGSIIVMIISFVVWQVTNRVIFVFIAAVLSLAMLIYRSVYVGDEDAVNATANRYIVDAALHRKHPEEPKAVSAQQLKPPAPWPDPVPDDFEPASESPNGSKS